ncbi:MAG: OsmC family protein [Alphaproteobacteria bacterium]|nr:OsmC family protein [Alphaproteobacteria bacterium]
MAAEKEKQATARTSGDAAFATNVEVEGINILVDEPASVGGGAAGPTPYELLSAALAACTSMTLRLYARGKNWDLPEFEVIVSHTVPPANPPRDRFDRHIVFKQPVTADRLQRLLEMADRCPVHRTLSRPSDVVTWADNPVAPLPSEPPGEHFRQMEQACVDEG